MTEQNASPRKPRIALMGEFSAGKSTLCNFLLGQSALPEKVTATRVPPVWMTYGDAGPVRISHDGAEEPVSLENLEDIPLEETRYIGMQFQADILKECDLLDLPGISDPNMSSEVWETMVEEIDAILWCTHATQSWRQSEAGVWATIPEKIQSNSLLLVTKFDKIAVDRDRQRVLSRLNHEAGELFDGIVPLSLLQAIRAESGSEEWVASGAGVFLQKLRQITDRIGSKKQRVPSARPQPIEALTENGVEADNVTRINDTVQLRSVDADAPEIDADEGGSRIIPRRIRPSAGNRSERPRGNGSKIPSLERGLSAEDKSPESDLRAAFSKLLNSEKAVS